MARCSRCKTSFRTMEDEADMHACPSCGFGEPEPPPPDPNWCVCGCHREDHEAGVCIIAEDCGCSGYRQQDADDLIAIDIVAALTASLQARGGR